MIDSEKEDIIQFPGMSQNYRLAVLMMKIERQYKDFC